jgi:hypothetical protein
MLQKREQAPKCGSNKEEKINKSVSKVRTCAVWGPRLCTAVELSDIRNFVKVIFVEGKIKV